MEESNPWNHTLTKIEDSKLTVNTSDSQIKKLRDIVHSEAMRLSVELQYAKRYDKAQREGEYTAYKRMWEALGGDIPEESK